MLTATQSKMDFMSTTEKAAFVLSLCYNSQRVEQPFYKLPQLLRTSTDTWNFIHMYSKYPMFLTALVNAHLAPFPGRSAFLTAPTLFFLFPSKKKRKKCTLLKVFFLNTALLPSQNNKKANLLCSHKQNHSPISCSSLDKVPPHKNDHCINELGLFPFTCLLLLECLIFCLLDQ